MVFFLLVLGYTSVLDPVQKVASLLDNRAGIYFVTLVDNVLFGVFLVVLTLALYERLRSGAPAIMQVATALGLIWAGLLIASGMVFNDYTIEDFTQGGPRYNLILDNVGNRSLSDLRRALSPQGVIVPNSGHGGMGYVFKAFLLSPFTRQVARPSFISNLEGLLVLKELIEAGKVTPEFGQ